MNDETAREKLAEALQLAPDLPVLWPSSDKIAAALLPVVREIAADEVDDIAESVRRLADGPVPAINDAFDAVVICRARADRLREPAGRPS